MLPVVEVVAKVRQVVIMGPLLEVVQQAVLVLQLETRQRELVPAMREQELVLVTRERELLLATQERQQELPMEQRELVLLRAIQETSMTP
jgi:hypothetical protein